MSEGEKALEALLKRSSNDISTEDIALLANNLVPTASKGHRTLAFLNLSKLVQATSSSSSNAKLVDSVKSYLTQVFSVDNDNPETYLPFTSFLGALFSLNPGLAIPILTATVPETVTTTGGESPDVLDVLLEAAELASPLQPALADLLGQAASTKQGREAIKKAEGWLRGAISYNQNGDLGVLCAVALSKLLPTEAPDTAEASETGDVDKKTIEEIALAKKMMDHITSSYSSSAALIPTIEGLSILSTKGHVKHLLATNLSFMIALLKLSPIPDIRPSSLPVTPRASIDIYEKIFEPVETSLCYGLTTILVNLTTPKPVLSAEDEQIAKLRAMAVSGKKGATVEDSPFDAQEAIEERVQATIKAGVIPALRGLVRAESLLVKEGLGRLCLNLFQDKTHRSIFIRDGGFKVLSQVVRDLLTPSKRELKEESSKAEGSYLPAIQALAKLVITTPPHLLFPPPHDTTSLNALSPLYMLLAHPSSSLLQTFEALMALTNLATINPTIAERIVSSTITPPPNDTMWRGPGREDKIKVMTRVEELLLDSNTLVRRAATELVCNLVNSYQGRTYFAGEREKDISPRIQSRLNVLLVLTSIDDTPTRLAAGGALAMITEDPAGCAALLSVKDETNDRSVWTRLLRLFEPDVPETDGEGEEIPVISSTPPNPDLILRAVVILFNLVHYVKMDSKKDVSERKKQYLGQAREAGLQEKIVEVIKGNRARRDIIEPAVELLRLLMEDKDKE